MLTDEQIAEIKEEIEEAQKELGDLYKHFSSFWDGVKHDARKAKSKTAEEALKLLYTALKAYPTVIEKEMN